MFHSQNKKSEIRQHLPPLKINNTVVERAKTSKFLTVVVDENLPRKPHINALALKTAKNIDIVFRSCDYINQNVLKQLYFSFMHSNINYANVRWGSTHHPKLEILYRYKK